MNSNLCKFFKKKKVLITGHTGFKGAWLAKILINWGADVLGMSLPPHTKPSLFQILNLESKIKNYFVDIKNFKKIHEIFKKEKPEIVFHLAAQALVRKSYDDPLETISSNTLGTANLLEVIRKIESVRSAVIVTTDKVYKNEEKNITFKESDALGGHDPYSASKSAADIIAGSYIKSFNLPVAIARAGNVIGGGDWSNDRIISDIVRSKYENGSKLVVRNPQAVRPWQHVFEPLAGYMLLAKALFEMKKDVAGAWNFGPDEKNFLTVSDLLKAAMVGIGHIDYDIIPDLSKHEANLLKLNSFKSKTILGWKPKLDFNDTIALTFDWYDKFYQKEADILNITDKHINSYFL